MYVCMYVKKFHHKKPALLPCRHVSFSELYTEDWCECVFIFFFSGRKEIP